MTASARVAAIVLNWNDAQCTISCLEALLAQNPTPLIIVCDNGSCDESLSSIRSWLEKRGLHTQEGQTPGALPKSAQADAYVLRNRENLGYAAGNNPGIRLALSLDAEFIWILNNDARPLEGALAALLKCASRQPKVGILGSTVVSAPPQSQTIQAAGGWRYHPLTTVAKPAYAGKKVREVPDLPEPALSYIDGACLFARAAVFQDIGLLNEAFFLFYEELDLCDRARAGGYELYWCRGALVEHFGGHSVESTPKAHIEYHENLSTVLYTRLHHPYLLFPALAFRLLAKLVLLPLRGHPARMSAVWKAYRDGLRRSL